MSALQGLKVLELGTLIAGALRGAHVRRVRGRGHQGRNPNGPDGAGGGDPIRAWRHLHEGNSLWWSVQARNKKSIALNLKTPKAGRSRAGSRWRPMWWSRTTGPAC